MNQVHIGELEHLNAETLCLHCVVRLNHASGFEHYHLGASGSKVKCLQYRVVLNVREFALLDEGGSGFWSVAAEHLILCYQTVAVGERQIVQSVHFAHRAEVEYKSVVEGSEIEVNRVEVFAFVNKQIVAAFAAVVSLDV